MSVDRAAAAAAAAARTRRSRNDQPQLADGVADRGRPRRSDADRRDPPVSTARIGGSRDREQALLLRRRDRAPGRNERAARPAILADRVGQPVARGIEPLEVAAAAMTRRPPAARVWLATRAPIPPNTPPSSSGNSGPSRKKRKVFDKHRRGEIAAGDDEGGADEAHHRPASSWPIAAAAALPAIATNASCRPGRSIASVSIPAPPSISALSSGSGPAFGQLEHPFVAFAPRARGNGRAPRPVRWRGCAAGRSAAAGRALRRRCPSNATLPLAMIAIRSHSRSAWAMTWVEKMIVAPSRASRADQLLEPRLVDRVEAGEGLVEDDQPRLVNDRARAAGRSAPCPWTSVRIGFFAQSPRPCCFEQLVGAAAAFAQRQAAQRAHEGDRLARVHRRIEAALLGQIADLRRRIERALVAEHAARSARRVDDPEQHAQGRGLAGAVGAEQAVDRCRSGTARLTPSTARVSPKSLTRSTASTARLRHSDRAGPVEAL